MSTTQLYQVLIDRAASDDRVSRILLGLNWSLAQLATEADSPPTGLCFSPVDIPRVLPWPGTLRGRTTDELRQWVLSWNACEATIGTAVINAVINSRSRLCEQALPLTFSGPPHLAVFEHFAPQLAGAHVAVIGRYPGLQGIDGAASFTCIERRSGEDVLPDSAAQFVLPKSDWVFITASSIANKSLPGLLALSRRATVVLMGPSLPWLAEWADFGVDYLAGVQVLQPEQLYQIAAEGGGTRIFDGAVHYAVTSLA